MVGYDKNDKYMTIRTYYNIIPFNDIDMKKITWENDRSHDRVILYAQ